MRQGVFTKGVLSVGSMLAVLVLPTTLTAQSDAINDCRRQASVATDAPISDIDARRDRDLENGRYSIVWNVNRGGGRAMSGFCEANRNGRIVRFETNTADRGNRGGRLGRNNARNNGGINGGNNRRRGDSSWEQPSGAQERIRAKIQGGGGDGKCTFEVEVDGVAEVEIQGDEGRLQTLGGSPATWRRLDCNQPLPRNPSDFQFKGIDGRGSQELIREPGSNGGRVVIRLEDPKGGREGYTGDIIWRR